MKNRNQAKAEQMRFHIGGCNKSGLTVNDYCTQNGLAKSCYYYWNKKLTVENKAAGFTAVEVTESSCVEIIYPNGVQLSFSGAINEATLKALICCI